MRTPIAAAALLALFAGCAVDRGAPATQTKQAAVADAPDPAPDTYALGSTLEASGAVRKDAAGEAFGRGGEVFLSVDVASASTDQTIEVAWLDGAGRVVRKETREVPVGTRYAAFASGRDVTSSAGTRRAVVVINGRRVTEKTFSVL